MVSPLASLFETAASKRVRVYLHETTGAFGDVKGMANKEADDSGHGQRLRGCDVRRLIIKA